MAADHRTPPLARLVPALGLAALLALAIDAAPSDTKPGDAAPSDAGSIRPRPAPDTSGDFWHVVFDVAAGDLNGDGRADLAVSSPDSGEVFVFAGPLARAATEPPPPTVTIDCGRGAGMSGNNTALLVADLDGTGAAELAIGNSETRDVLVFVDPFRSARVRLGRADAAAVLRSGTFGVGSSLAAGRGESRETEIAIAGATETSSRVFFASGRALPRTLDLDSAASRVLSQFGARPFCEDVGWDLEYADVDGDRVPELLVGSHRAPGRRGESTAGRLDVYRRSGPASALESIATVYGREDRDRFGRAIAVLDFDRDGRPDLATCSSHARRRLNRAERPRPDGDHDSPEESEARNVGEVYLVPNRLLRDGAASLSNDAAIRLLHGSERDERFGWTILAGDFDGDGGDDLVVAGKFASAKSGAEPARGRIYFVANSLLRDSRPWDDVRESATIVAAPEGVRHFGMCGAVADLDGDGYVDAAIGGMSGEGEGPFTGRLAILYGGPRLMKDSPPVMRTIR